jgi:bifunctional non-homologous end joining protein LigD
MATLQQPKYLEAMLAENANPKRLDALCNDDNYWADQKLDGHRCLMHVQDGRVIPVSRSGLELPVNAAVLKEFEAFKASNERWVFDGEYIDQMFYIFDLVEAGRHVSPNVVYEDRRDVLEHFYKAWDPSGWVHLIPTKRTTADKAALAAQVEAQGGEGLMFKRRDAGYTPGRRNPALLKIKFRHDVDCIVINTNLNGKANMSLGLLDANNDVVEVGECTALAGDGPRIKPGDVVTVIYLYATKDNRLYQPTKPLIRTDKRMRECTMDQLRYADKTVIL